MRALVKFEAGPGHVELRPDWPAPTARPGWVVVSVAACGICGTDLHIWHDEFKSWPPVVMGHEYVGRIVEVGPEVTGWKVGDRVVCEQHAMACGHCYSCRRGAVHLCPEKRSQGIGIDGAFADRVALPAWLLHRVPDGVPDEVAVITEPLAICVTGADRAELRPGEVALVVGAGPIGLLSSLVLRASGAVVLMAGRLSTSQARMEIARSLGIPTVSTEPEEVQARLGALSEGRGADLVVEASGSEGGLALAVRSLRRQGRIVCLGIGGRETVAFPADEAMRRSLDIRFSFSSEYSAWDRALALLATGAVDPRRLVRIYPLEEWRAAFDDLAVEAVVKAALSPTVHKASPTLTEPQEAKS
jgi:threonine dehydrogenase-like Zn-dependent dehydrogenase